MSKFKVALVQYSAVANAIEKNMILGLKYMEEAKTLGADIILFPEMWSNGYAPPFEKAFDNPYDSRYEKDRENWLVQAVDEESDYVKAFRDKAKQLEIGVIISYLSKGQVAPQNTAVVIDRKGEILMKYSKVHTCDFSLEALLESGTRFNVCDFEGIKLGLMICYDREFPESARILMLKGAEIILVPNACDMNPARRTQLSTRSFENMVGIAMANYPGQGWGNSCAYSPIVFDENGNYKDNQIVLTNDTDEKIVMVEFDIEAIRDYREREVWGNAYRKVSTYGKLLDTEVNEPFIRDYLD